ncbi:MAG TPA: hypothetical protein VF173_18610 [Thermoanaerobaculia bacterium]|nr:hypothetical protein [Thermoanaerobaculia bacterium]
MRPWTMAAALALAGLLSTGWAQAQTSNRDDRDRDDEGGRNRDRFAFGIGAGLVEPSGGVENYYMAALRIRVSGRDDEGGRRRATGDEGVTGYLEPEVGYWKASGNHGKGSDTLLGVNLIGVVPFGSVDSFFGVGAALHSTDKSLIEDDPTLTGTESKFGADAQFGIDIYLTNKLSVFGTGRFDLVQGAQSRVQSKVYLGLRARF